MLLVRLHIYIDLLKLKAYKLFENSDAGNLYYSGVTFNCTGSYVLNNQCLKGKSLRSMFALINNIKKYQIKSDIALSLFDSFVVPIFKYANPIRFFLK